jgi:hypothetical protein
MQMRYDYELDENMKLFRWNPKTEKSSRIAGLFGNEEAAKRAASCDLMRMKNLSKTGEITARFSGSGQWESLSA